MLFQIQTHEVVQDLKKIRELLNNPEEIQAPNTPKAKKEEIKEEPTEIDNKIEWQETREKEAKQFLKDNWVSNRKFLKGEKAINKAIELGFNI